MTPDPAVASSADAAPADRRAASLRSPGALTALGAALGALLFALVSFHAAVAFLGDGTGRDVAVVVVMLLAAGATALAAARPPLGLAIGAVQIVLIVVGAWLRARGATAVVLPAPFDVGVLLTHGSWSPVVPAVTAAVLAAAIVSLRASRRPAPG
ncbi:hypothetical protein [Cellulomonas sp.]|uniref:hypothetical protein n=1 Tax=Cellulomonas sp. TaxID=40001 RepID=UPI002D38ADE0|nr:hypothetical protein [Cellulomonas sp.]HYQ74043.1 hypothetical protein [Cellulomonas sp.]